MQSQVVVRESFIMVTSDAEDGRDSCGLWLNTRRVGRQQLTIVHSSPSVLMVAARSRTIEANVVAAHSPVEGHERAEALWEALVGSIGRNVDGLRQRCTDVPVHRRDRQVGVFSIKKVLEVWQRIKKHAKVRDCIVSVWERTFVL